MQRLVRYDWPGNVRELEKVVRRAAILVDDGEAETRSCMERKAYRLVDRSEPRPPSSPTY